MTSQHRAKFRKRLKIISQQASNAAAVSSKPATTAVMADPDEFDDPIRINGEIFESFAKLRDFISQNYPEKFADFQQKYGKCSS